MTTDEIKSSNPLDEYIASLGAKLIGSGNQRITNRCAMVQHKPGHNCVTIALDKQLWHCNDCGRGGDVITWIAIQTGKSTVEVIKGLGGNEAAPKWKPLPQRTEPQEEPETDEKLKFDTVSTYDYRSATGELVYQVLRQHAACKSRPGGYAKTFKQRRPDASGGWIYNMDGVERVLYRMPEVITAKQVWVVEGEKDAETLARLGICATCNVGGAGKWMDAYSESLAKKVAVVCGDNDDPGRKHSKDVFDSLAGTAKSVRWVKVPESHKDITDYVSSFSSDEEAKRAIFALFDGACPFVRGVGLPVFKLSELEDLYKRHIARLDCASLALSKWLPSLARIRSLVPGELVLLLGATGIGKTAALVNIALKAHPMPTLFFELELPAELMFERALALKTKMSCLAIESAYKTGDTLGEEAIDQKLSHFHICTQSRLTAAEIERLIVRSELKIGERPRLVLVDYIGLVHGAGKSRYERVSSVAEDLKVIAKVTQTIIIIASQVGRDEDPEIRLSSGKDSGSLENSSGLVIGMWRDDEDATTMHLNVLKSTKGGAGTRLVCNYNLDTLEITERSKISDDAVPDRRYAD